MPASSIYIDRRPLSAIEDLLRFAQLGRGLISPEPDANGSELEEGEVVFCKLVIPGGDAPTLFDLVEEPFDQVSGAIQIRAKADRIFAISFGRDVSPCSLLARERSDPVCVISSTCQATSIVAAIRSVVLSIAGCRASPRA